MKIGDIVKYKKEFPDEVGSRYEITEINGDRCFIKAIIPCLLFPPVTLARMEDLELYADA